MHILSIETSADETAAAVTEERKVLSNVIYSQILLHKKWGGIYPSLAKRAHEERIDRVVEKAINNFNNSETPHATGSREINLKNIDYIAVTQGPGLAIALEVGIKKAKELAKNSDKKLIPVNHLEGHIYSSFVQNSRGNPKRNFDFPYLALIISGGHTEIVLFKDHLNFAVLGETRDDAAGEALDKAAKMLGLGYPGGPVIERLAQAVNNRDIFNFPRPMIKSGNLDFSFSGLKTSLYYFLQKLDPDEKIQKIKDLAGSFQAAVFETILTKTEMAIIKTGINRVVVGGGVIANLYLRSRLRKLLKKYKGEASFPAYKYLSGDNAAMIGVAAFYKAQKGMFSRDLSFERTPRLTLS